MFTGLKALTVLFVVPVLVADQAEARHHHPDCHSFSCGPLGNVKSPFRQASDPPRCGYKSYELICSDTKAMIRINNASYYVSAINYNSSSFCVHADLDLYNNCPVPRGNLPYQSPDVRAGMDVELAPVVNNQACFVQCSQEVVKDYYIACLSSNGSFVYVLGYTGCDGTQFLEPSCGFLSVTQLPQEVWQPPHNQSYADIVKSMRRGFAVRFPYIPNTRWGFSECMRDACQFSEEPIRFRIVTVLLFAGTFVDCALAEVELPNWWGFIIELVVGILTQAAVLCRFVLAPLAVLTFLAYEYWKTRITIDAVEKFLRMQQMLGPTRYAYTDIRAITGHFRDKLGQGGYGSVYKGVLLPRNVHVAIKMLVGSSNCNGEDFISEVSTIGRIHHVNVVRLVGFCPEKMRQALVYEYMPRGSLDKYIFSAENSFSWDKLNEIALGIARGIDYLHRGCDMQILHFDIKPHNILLDSNFIPKVADFSLTKLYPRDKSFVPSRALRGTIGYIAPEMISRSFGVVSSKSDVYSFGMLLLEIAGGRRNADPNATNSSQAYYPAWVYDQLIQEDHVGEISARVDDMDMHELERKMCIVGLWCIQMRSHDRQTMSEVIKMLEGGFDGLQMPSRPFFCDDEHTTVPDSYPLLSELTEISEEDEISDSYVSRVL